MTLRWSATAVLALIVSCRAHHTSVGDDGALTVSFKINDVKAESLHSFQVTNHWKVDVNGDHCRLVQESVGRYRDTITVYDAKPCLFTVSRGEPDRICFTNAVLRGDQGEVRLDGCVARTPYTPFDFVEEVSREEFEELKKLPRLQEEDTSPESSCRE